MIQTDISSAKGGEKRKCLDFEEKIQMKIVIMLKWVKIDKTMKTYSSRKKPASLKHLTLAFVGKYLAKASQWWKVANPPAEQPESKAYTREIVCIINFVYII